MSKQKIYGIIYCAENIISGKMYIGQTTKTLQHRKYQHENYIYTKNRFTRALYSYGKENFKWKILRTCFNLEELNRYETHFITLYNTLLDGYNLNGGGEGRSPSEEARINMSNAHKGLKDSLEDKLNKYIPSEHINMSDCEEWRLNISRGNGGKAIIVYDIDGNFVGEYIHQLQACQILNLDTGSVNRMIKKKTNYVKQYVLFNKDEFTLELLENHLKLIKNKNGLSKRIKDSEGNIFKSISECAKQYCISSYNLQNIISGKRGNPFPGITFEII